MGAAHSVPSYFPASLHPMPPFLPNRTTRIIRPVASIHPEPDQTQS